MDAEDSQEEFEKELNAQIVSKMQEIHSPRYGDEQDPDQLGETGFIKVKAKAKGVT